MKSLVNKIKNSVRIEEDDFVRIPGKYSGFENDIKDKVWKNEEGYSLILKSDLAKIEKKHGLSLSEF